MRVAVAVARLLLILMVVLFCAVATTSSPFGGPGMQALARESGNDGRGNDSLGKTKRVVLKQMLTPETYDKFVVKQEEGIEYIIDFLRQPLVLHQLHAGMGEYDKASALFLINSIQRFNASPYNEKNLKWLRSRIDRLKRKFESRLKIAEKAGSEAQIKILKGNIFGMKLMISDVDLNLRELR